MQQIPDLEKQTLSIHPQGLATLLKVSNALSASLELNEVLQTAITSVTETIGVGTGAIYTLEGDELYLGATTPPLPPEFPIALRLANINNHPHIKKSIETKAPVYIEDTSKVSLSAEEQIVVDTRHLISILYFPLFLKSEAIGVFIVGTKKRIHKFTEQDIDLCYILSTQSSLAITNARLYQTSQEATEDIMRAYDSTLEGWSRVLDMRDRITDEHTKRTAELTVALARRMGFPESEIEHIRRGALLHDIGKMAVSDVVLQKAAELTSEEFEIIKQHPVIAYELLSHIDFLAPALDIPYCHHERWNGTGYPRQLKGEEIPLSARLFAVVDVYDSITSERPYHEAWDKDVAIAYIRDESGKHFCPHAVDAFLEMMAEFDDAEAGVS